MNDNELLARFARDGSAEAFRELVGRHTNFVYSCACQRLRDTHAAQDVTQSVFLALAATETLMLAKGALTMFALNSAKTAVVAGVCVLLAGTGVYWLATHSSPKPEPVPAPPTVAAHPAVALTSKEPEAALAWLESLPAGSARDQAAWSASLTAGRENPAAAVTWAELIQDEQKRARAYSSVVSWWASRDRAAATAWANQLPAGPARDAAIAALGKK